MYELINAYLNGMHFQKIYYIYYIDNDIFLVNVLLSRENKVKPYFKILYHSRVKGIYKLYLFSFQEFNHFFPKFYYVLQ